MMTKLLIIGTGDYALTVAYFLQSQYDIVGFAEERAFRKKPDLNGKPIFDFEDVPALFDSESIKMLVAVGPNRVNKVRERLYLEAKSLGYELIKYIHPSAYVWDEKAVGENSVVFPLSVIEPFATVGNNCVLWSGATIAHHSAILDHCFIAPGARISGRTTIHNNCFIGINATVRDNVQVKENCIIGGGAVIMRDTEPNGVYSASRAALLSLNSLETKV